jgi:hypothetical protein
VAFHRHSLRDKFQAVISILDSQGFTPINPVYSTIHIIPSDGYPESVFDITEDAFSFILNHGGTMTFWKDDLDVSLWFGASDFDETIPIWTCSLSIDNVHFGSIETCVKLHSMLRNCYLHFCLRTEAVYGYIGDEIILEAAIDRGWSISNSIDSRKSIFLFLENYFSDHFFSVAEIRGLNTTLMMVETLNNGTLIKLKAEPWNYTIEAVLEATNIWAELSPNSN